MAVSRLTEGQDTDQSSFGGRLLRTLAGKLTRWDAIYFTQRASRGAQFEQEWAFGWGFAMALRILGQLQPGDHNEERAALAGILISAVAHLTSALVLYQLTQLVAARPTSPEALRLAFVSASLHIISPAGIFLMAPYAESCFSCLNFAGFYLYSLGSQYHHTKQYNVRDISILISSLFFGLATTFRSNGLLSGLLFCLDLSRSCVGLKSSVQSGLLPSNLRRMTILVVAGGFVSLGFIYPQYLAYHEYCMIPGYEDRPSWCTKRLPSIYTWILQSAQADEDRNVGLFRYWTVSNAPLFLLAAPMLLIIFISSVWALPSYQNIQASPNREKMQTHRTADRDWMSLVGLDTARWLAVTQLILAILALTSYHVQIITRISSGYPLWYLYIASQMVKRSPITLAGFSLSARHVVIWMVVYALLQASLFAAFLPPA
ncbi:MAG: hypothetical protein Q9194_002620 [Teloschistes cf. exilis]